MSEQPRIPSAAHAAGRRKRPSGPQGRSRVVTAGAVVLTIVAGAAVTNLLLGPSEPASGQASDASTGQSAVEASGCPLPGGALTIAAAPEIAAVVSAIAADAAEVAETFATCPVRVTSVDPADFPAAGETADRPDVWLPDSSVWIPAAADSGLTTPAESPSIAVSPVVHAVTAGVATELTADGSALDLGRILGSRLSTEPVRVGLPDPARSAAAVGSLLDVRAFVVGRSDARAAFTWALRSSPEDLPTAAAPLLARLAVDPRTAVPVTEQAVWAHNAMTGAVPAVPVYPGPTGAQLDYPYVVLTTDDDAKVAAADFLAVLTADDAQVRLQASGFRDLHGKAGPVLTAENGFDPSPRTPAEPLVSDVVEDAIRTVELSNQPSRLLALLDISASMRAVVPDSGGATRLTLAKDAAARGLGLYPADSELGLWTFSTNLTPTSDYAELVPVGPLTPSADGTTGQQRIAAALAATEVKPNGGTGLYDSVLEAVRQMRASWDPDRVNSVIVLSDGQNDDDGISLANLLATLRSEADPNRPVPVIAIAFGPDSDVDAMTQIADVTGGATYISADPRMVGEIFFDAVGQRLCRPEC